MYLFSSTGGCVLAQLLRKSEPLNVIIFKRLKFSLTDFQVRTVVCDSERMTGLRQA